MSKKYPKEEIGIACVIHHVGDRTSGLDIGWYWTLRLQISKQHGPFNSADESRDDFLLNCCLKDEFDFCEEEIEKFVANNEDVELFEENF